MSVTVEKFNIIPNFKYFVKFSQEFGYILVEVFNTAADLIGGTNRVAYASGVETGANVQITLTNDSTLPVIRNRNIDALWHIQATLSFDNLPLNYELGPFFVIRINDPLVSSGEMQEARANLEINRGSHAVVGKSCKAEHDASRVVGDIVDLSVHGKSQEKNRLLKLEQRYVFNDGKPTLFDILTLESYENLGI
jgi:hypothetical protein